MLVPFSMKISSNRYIVLSIVILLIGAAWIWVSASPSDTSTAGQAPAPQVGFYAPDLKLPTMNGEAISLENLRGQPVMINFWASWCPPCRSEMPAMQNVFDEYKDQGLLLLGINAANQDNRTDAVDFIEQNRLTFPVLFDTGGQAAYDYQVRSLPTTFFIDQEGKVQDIIVGGPISETLLRIRVEQLMHEVP
jgi:peroxiredoxin